MSKNYDVDYRRLSERGGDLARILLAWKRELAEANSRITVLQNTGSISGATAERMSRYFNDIHGNIQSGFQKLLDMVQFQWDIYFNTYTEIDPAKGARIFVPHIEARKETMGLNLDVSMSFDDDITKVLNRISDIYEYPYTRIITDPGVYEASIRHIENLSGAIEAHEENCRSAVADTLSEVIGYISATIQANLGQNAMYKRNYTGEANGVDYAYMMAYSDALGKYLENNKEAVIKARAGTVRYADELRQYDIEMAERKKREEKVNSVKPFLNLLTSAFSVGAALVPGGAMLVVTSGLSNALESGFDSWCTQYIEGGWEGVDWGQVGRSTFIGSAKGVVLGGMSSMIGSAFSKLGKVGFIADASQSSSFLTKHGTKLGLKIVESGTKDVVGGITGRYITSGTEAWVIDGQSGFDFGKATTSAFDANAIKKDIAESVSDTVTSYGVENGLESLLGVQDINRKTEIRPGMVGKATIIGAATEISSGISKRGVGTYVESRLQGKDVDEALDAAYESALDKDKIKEDFVSGSFEGAADPYADRKKKQTEYEEELEKQLRKEGLEAGKSKPEIDSEVKTRLKQERERWEKELDDQKQKNAELRKNIDEKEIANTDAEIKQLNEMRENGELDIEDDPNEKIRKNVNSGNYAHERRQLEEMYENGELDAETNAGAASAGGESVSGNADSGSRRTPPGMANAWNDYKNPDLFRENEAGDITYTETENGKEAYGSLKYNDDPERNQHAQRTAGGDERRPDDHGGHLIAASEGGDPGKDNLVAMNDDLNTGRYKDQEMQEINDLKDGAKVYKYVETYGANDSERPDTIMGYTVTEHPDGSRDVEMFHTPNESDETLAEWDAIAGSMPDDDDIPNAMVDEHYEELHRIEEKKAADKWI